MTRMLKALGLSFVAVLALSAMAATAAQAHKFVAEKSPAVLTGTNEEGTKDTFTINGNEVQCEDAHFVATQEKSPSEELTVVPDYEYEGKKCQAFGSSATVTVNHCAYEFSANTTGEHAHVNVECAEGNEITIQVPAAFVTLHVPAQTTTEQGVRYYNLASGEVTVEATVKNIKAKCTGFGCSLLGGENVTGEYNAKDIVAGYEDTGSKLEGTEATTQANYSMGETRINIEVEGAPSK